MPQVIRDLMNSKKFVTALMGVITAITVELGIPEVEVAELTAILSPFLAYIGFQGFGDAAERRERQRSAPFVAAMSDPNTYPPASQ